MSRNLPSTNELGTYWFADRLEPDDSAYVPGWRPEQWGVFLQGPGMVHPVAVAFGSKEDAEDFLTREVAGAGVEAG